jgi:hypothetical protein
MKKIILILTAAIAILTALALLIIVPEWAMKIYGPANPSLSTADKFQYAALMLWHDGLLTHPRDPNGKEITFRIESGEAV